MSAQGAGDAHRLEDEAQVVAARKAQVDDEGALGVDVELEAHGGVALQTALAVGHEAADIGLHAGVGVVLHGEVELDPVATRYGEGVRVGGGGVGCVEGADPGRVARVVEDGPVGAHADAGPDDAIRTLGDEGRDDGVRACRGDIVEARASEEGLGELGGDGQVRVEMGAAHALAGGDAVEGEAVAVGGNQLDRVGCDAGQELERARDLHLGEQPRRADGGDARGPCGGVSGRDGVSRAVFLARSGFAAPGVTGEHGERAQHESEPPESREPGAHGASGVGGGCRGQGEYSSH